MKLFNKMALSAAALAGTATMGVGILHAATISKTGFNPMGNLLNAIATKFNLNTADVQKVFDDQRDQMQQQRQTQQAERQKTMLDQAVKDGKITQAQEDLIIAKHKEVQTFMSTLTGKTEAERQAAIKTETDSIQAWAKTNSIPEQYVMMFGRGEGPRGRGMTGGGGMHRMMQGKGRGPSAGSGRGGFGERGFGGQTQQDDADGQSASN